MSPKLLQLIFTFIFIGASAVAYAEDRPNIVDLLKEDTKFAKDDLLIVKEKLKALSSSAEFFIGDVYGSKRKIVQRMKAVSFHASSSLRESPKVLREAYKPISIGADNLLEKLRKIAEGSRWLPAEKVVSSSDKPAANIVTAAPKEIKPVPVTTITVKPASTTIARSGERRDRPSASAPLHRPASAPLPPVGGPQGGLGKDVAVPNVAPAAVAPPTLK